MSSQLNIDCKLLLEIHQKGFAFWNKHFDIKARLNAFHGNSSFWIYRPKQKYSPIDAKSWESIIKYWARFHNFRCQWKSINDKGDYGYEIKLTLGYYDDN